MVRTVAVAALELLGRGRYFFNLKHLYWRCRFDMFTSRNCKRGGLRFDENMMIGFATFPIDVCG